MWQVLEKLFVRSFYKANAGFFLFFFFLFFGVVQGGSLVSYHLSLMTGILGSSTTLLVVLVCWLFYHGKCTAFFLRIINSEEGKFLFNLQAIESPQQWLYFLLLYLLVYAPVLVYSFVLVWVGYSKGTILSATVLLLFQALSVVFFTGVINYRLNHWLQKIEWPVLRLRFQKHFCFYVFFYFMQKRKNLLLLLKLFSLSLLYLVLVWNRGTYDNDAFLLFYLVLLLAHAALPYFAVQFLEKEFAVSRNLPLTLGKRFLAFLLPYFLLLLPECLYILLLADAFSAVQRLAYCVNLLASLWLLTAFLYSEAQRKEEYLKASFAVVFLSIFLLHVQAFWLWIVVQFVIATILFVSGYNKFEPVVEE